MPAHSPERKVSRMSDTGVERATQAATEVHITDLVLPNQTNNHGTMFGGEVLSMMDKAAGIAALRFCRKPVVTASTERIDFRTPIHTGEIIEATAKVAGRPRCRSCCWPTRTRRRSGRWARRFAA